MDADTGAVLYGKNIHESYYPASITKILTALVVIEHVDDLEEMVTFSSDAVYNVEAGSSNAHLAPGDQLSVRNCLYALLLKSANESANALAEHVAGSREEFAKLMNEKAQSLGCTESNFANPSGLNDPNHYTTAYDMAKISQAAFENPTFVEIDSTSCYDLPATKNEPEGQTIYCGHKMLKHSAGMYYDGIIGGKTGYTTLAGNTLVTCAERDGMKLISVILNGHLTHYDDTKILLDFGFNNFQSLRIADYDTTYASMANDMTIAGLPTTDMSLLSLDRTRHITIPKTAVFDDALSTLSYDLADTAPADAVAKIEYSYNDRIVGSAYLLTSATATVTDVTPSVEIPTAAPTEAPEIPVTLAGQPEAADGADTSGNSRLRAEDSTASLEGSDETADDSGNGFRLPQLPSIQIPTVVWIVLGCILALGALIGGIIAWFIHSKKVEEENRLLRWERRQERLKEQGISTDEFNNLVQQRRASSSYTTTRKSWKHRK